MGLIPEIKPFNDTQLKDFLLNLLDDDDISFVEDSLVFSVEGKTTLEDIYVSESNEYDDPNAYINDLYARGLPHQED